MSIIEEVNLVLSLDSGVESTIPVPLTSIQGEAEQLLDSDARFVIKLSTRCPPTSSGEEWQQSDSFELASGVDQTCFPTFYNDHVFSSLYESYLAILMEQMTLSVLQYHPNGIMQFPDFYLEPASRLIPELGDTGIFVEYKPSFPSESTISQAFKFLSKSDQKCMLIAYGNPLNVEKQAELVYTSLKEQLTNENKCRGTGKNGLKWLVVQRPPESVTDDVMQSMTVVPAEYLCDNWLLGIVHGEIGLYRYGRKIVEGLKCAIATLLKSQPTQHLLKRLVICTKKHRKKRFTACILRSYDTDTDFEGITALLTQHVLNLPVN